MEKPFDKGPVTGGGQPPGCLLGAYRESARAQGIDGQSCPLRAGLAGASLMIIEGQEQPLVVGVRRANSQRTGDRKAEKSRHSILDRGAAHGPDLVGGQHIEQGRAGDEVPIAAAVGQEPPERLLHAAVDDHRVLGQRQRSADRRIMIEMDPALDELQAGRQPALVGTRSGTEVDDLQGAAATAVLGQVVDQLGDEAAEGGVPGGRVGGGAGGEPGWVDSGLCRRYR